MDYQLRIPARQDFVIGFIPNYATAVKTALELSTLIRDLRISVYRKVSSGLWEEDCFYLNGE